MGDLYYTSPDSNLSAPAGVVDDPPVGGEPGLDHYEFHTAEDERVCPQCGPLDGARLTGNDTWALPPLHTHCRCWWEFLYSDSPEPPMLPPEPGPGPGPFNVPLAYAPEAF